MTSLDAACSVQYIDMAVLWPALKKQQEKGSRRGLPASKPKTLTLGALPMR